MKHFSSGLMVTLLLASIPAFGADTDCDGLQKECAQVRFVYRRLTGNGYPASADLATWSKGLAAAADKAAYLNEVVAKAATENDGFYSVTVLDFAQLEGNKDRALADGTGVLNDLTATVIGLVRDEKDYRTILYDDVLYVPNGATYAPGNNTIYETLYNNVKGATANVAPVALGTSLTAATQTGATGLAVQAGIFTMRGFGSVYYEAGTNRGPVRFTSINYLCRDMEDLSDVSRSDVFVRRDVDRAPGGDASKYRTECVGCHAGMDPLAGAFSYIDYVPPANAQAQAPLLLAAAPIVKVNRNNDTFPGGAVVTNDGWLNLWLEGTNSALGWDPAKKSGNGLKSFGEMIAATKMFPECMAKRVYKTVCLKEGTAPADKEAIAKLSTEFQKTYNMKELFKDTAVECGLKVGL
jgi:hypothetical protein